MGHFPLPAIGFATPNRALDRPSRRPGRRLSEPLARAVLASGSLLVGLVVVESGLALAGAGSRYAPPAQLIDNRFTVGLDCYPTNPRGYFEIDLRAPATRDRYRSLRVRKVDQAAPRAPFAVEFRYNGLLFRDADPGPRRPGVRRVIVLGDSFTEGQGVKERDTYARVLHRMLEAAEPGRWEVINWGRRGADFPVLYELFEQLLAYEPDLVVYGMVLNDAERSPEFEARQRYVNDWINDRLRVEPDPGGTPGQGLVLPLVLGDRLRAWQVGRESTRWYREMYGQANREGWARTQQSLRAMHRRLGERGARLLVAVWPLLVGLDGSYPFTDVHRTIAAACHRAGVAHHDLLPALRGQAAESLWVHPLDLHPNEIGHRLAAASLAPAVRALFDPS